MGSDRTRISYDPTQQYRAVVAQQGRVTLETDWNEAQQIASEELREETLDFVGVSGTPDDGYKVVSSAGSKPFDFATTLGTMYVGGVRAFVENPIQYSDQLDWLNREGDPNWVDLGNLIQSPPVRELVYLLLQEQEVSAVEDSDLLEKALGGPDTTQRLRLIQHIVRSQTKGETCSSAIDEAIEIWRGQGLQFDRSTLRLSSSATLQVSFAPLPTPVDLCEPEARSGYLGADNQLIRVQISGFDPITKQYQLVWGFDNAAFLYRVEVVNHQTLRLKSRPVDEFHRPRTNQAVEVLRSAAKLHNEEYIAAATGLVTTLTAPYNPDTREVSLTVDLTTVLPDEYFPTPPTSSPPTPSLPPLFFRVWQESIPFTPDVPVSLGQTGLQVTLHSPSNQPFHIGDYWQIAVRPGEPMQIYPHRYLTDPQPSDGPRLWVCPLAVIDWKDRQLNIIEDCRNPFDNLVDLTRRNLGGCCTVTVRPEDITQSKPLQSILDRFTNRDRITICLMPGTYYLPEPLLIRPEHANLTLEGCHDGAVIEAERGKEANFIQGLIILNRANNVTLRRLRFQMPQVRFFEVGGTIAGLRSDLISRSLPRLRDLSVSIGIRPLHCALLTVENCLFRYELTQGADTFGVGIFAGSECWGLTIKNCRFLHDDEYLQNLQEPLRMLIGYLLAPTITLKDRNATNSQLSGGMVRSLLQDACFENNRFVGLTFAALIMADTGGVSMTNNTVVDCYSGFWLLTLRNLSLQDEKLREIASSTTDDPIRNLDKLVALSVLGMIQEPITYLTIMLAQGYALPSQFNPRDTIQVSKRETRLVTVSQPLSTVMAQVRNTFSDTSVSLPNLNLSDIANNIQFNPADFATKETIGFAKTLGDRLEAIKLAAFQRSVQFPLQLSLDFSHNAITTLTPKAPSGTPLFVWDTDQQTQSMITMNANRLRNKSFQLATAVILQVDRCVVTGNLVLNESVYQPKPNTKLPEPLNIFYSLVLLPGWVSLEVLKNPPTLGFDVPISITGNVFKGFPYLLHFRPWPVPLNTWLPFNTSTW